MQRLTLPIREVVPDLKLIASLIPIDIPQLELWQAIIDVWIFRSYSHSSDWGHHMDVISRRLLSGNSESLSEFEYHIACAISAPMPTYFYKDGKGVDRVIEQAWVDVTLDPLENAMLIVDKLVKSTLTFSAAKVFNLLDRSFGTLDTKILTSITVVYADLQMVVIDIQGGHWKP